MRVWLKSMGELMVDALCFIDAFHVLPLSCHSARVYLGDCDFLIFFPWFLRLFFQLFSFTLIYFPVLSRVMLYLVLVT